MERRLDALGLALMGWWAWPAGLVATAILVLAVSWLYVPGPDPQVTVFGQPAFPPCRTLADTGLPCGQCGMTRSWVWAARGHPWSAFRYSPAGFAAWVAIVAAGGVGAVRLARRDPSVARLSWWSVGALATAWGVLYFASYELRLAGFNPLP